MSNRLTRAAMAAALLALPATTLAAQARTTAARPATPSSTAAANARTWLNELQRISARLQAAHNRAMQDAALRTAQESFMRDVKVAMQRVDPGLDGMATRVRAIQTEGAAAQQRGDRARLRTLNQELSQIQARFMTAQQAVMRQPAMAARAAQLEQQLHGRMLQVEPETDQLIERGKELQARLARAQAAARQRQSATPPPAAGPVRRQ
ncbi:MAG TPA: hypothetical protein VFR81_01905 [Longimicrobium sp.]|nr:hypothetical protein [Longimicrobium sp.]